MQDLTTQTPVEIDTPLADLYYEQAKIWARIGRMVRNLEHYEADLDRHDSDLARRKVLEARDQLEALRVEHRGLVAQIAPYEAEYGRRPWNRYFLVTNGNGHVHRGMHCSTCFPTTEYSWLVNLADCDEDAMIEEWGERACTVCFPTAPTNPLYNRPARVDREAREAKAAEKAAKAAEKAAKAITDVDGSPLKVGGDTLKTKVAARNALSSAFQCVVFYGADHPQDFVAQIRQLVPALRLALPEVDLAAQAKRAIDKAVKDSQVPPNNPFRLTQEQILAAKVEISANRDFARQLAKEVIG